MRLPIAAGLATAAAALTLYPLFRGGTWFWAGMGAIIVIVAASVLTARHTTPRWLGPPAELLVLGVYLTVVFTRDDNWAWILPTKDSALSLAGLLGQGLSDIQHYAAPVPDQPPIALLAVGGIGLIAVLVDLTAVRLRRAALAGLPLLALFTVPAAVLTDPIGWPAFIIGALGYVGLLTADGRERLSHWGRAVLVRRSRGTGARAQVDTAPLSVTGKRIGFAAIALAILLPALLPTLEPSPLFGFGVGSGDGRGGNTITIPNPIASLRGQLTQPANATVLTYSNNDNVPRYLRMYALDTFDGAQWTMSQPKGRPEDRVSEGPMPPPPGLSTLVPLKPFSTRITVSDDVEGLSFLPLPYPSSTVRVDGDWRADQSSLMVFSTRDTAGGQTYSVTGQEPQPPAEDLRAMLPASDPEILTRYLALPPDLPRQIRALAHERVSDTDTPYEMAVKLQSWFTGGDFVYSLATQGNGNDALADFLRNRAGYCEQFAAAMAVMARVLGIPARVGIGYTGGSFIGGTWQVRTHDLHAWPELYFQGAGWLRFEPTPAGGLGQATARVPDYSRPPVDAAAPGDVPSAGPSDGTETSDPAGALGARGRTPRDPDTGLPVDPVAVDPGVPLAGKIGIGVGILLLIGLIPAAARTVVRRRRRRAWARAGVGGLALDATSPEVPAGTAAPPERRAGMAGPSQVRTQGRVPAPAAHLGEAVHGSWQELIDTLYDLGLGHEASESPRALARRVAEQCGLDQDAAASVTAIAAAEERMRYARTPGPVRPLDGDLRRVRDALRAGVTRGRRLRATLLPPSTLRRLRHAGEKVLDGFDRLETLRLWPRRRDVAEPTGADLVEERVLTGSRR
ncbi:transglutaminaseTgpA domain-containing protein [Sphaerisporangium rhizosphaerae]|uniref:TransglutaminaseTgpA domain-containing protein n=1 Tax=Sphaerisporangium rhizosphaerae TaxID=2269375 RepID=A0ABW2PBX2_9ACTN